MHACMHASKPPPGLHYIHSMYHNALHSGGFRNPVPPLRALFWGPLGLRVSHCVRFVLRWGKGRAELVRHRCEP